MNRTRQYYNDAIFRRNLVYFPTMLRIMTSKFQPYRLMRRLWIQAIQRIFRNYCRYLVPTVIDFLSEDRIEPIPMYFTKYHESHLQYDSLNTEIRFKQLTGRLVTLGFPERDNVEVDYEYESYLSKFHDHYHPSMTDLYHQLCQKGISHKWHIMLSYLPCHLQYDLMDWELHVASNRLLLTLQAFHRTHQLSSQEYTLMTAWIERMKFPSC
jgi:hypothetical protein